VISLVVAVSDNDVIGVNNQLPWRLPNDLQRFKAITMGKAIVMGRKTFDSIGRPLPGRRNIVVSRRDAEITGCTVVNSMQAALAAAQDSNETMVIGGADIYRQALPMAQRIYLTRVHAVIEGDAGFPRLNDQEWNEVSCEPHSADERHAYPYSFLILERITT